MAGNLTELLALSEWKLRWEGLAKYTGVGVPDEAGRIARVVELWREPIPRGWLRREPYRLLLGERYRRGDIDRPSPEHAVELEIVGRGPEIPPGVCFGSPIKDGVTAVPLTEVAGAKVEADVLLLTGEEHEYRLVLAEVKEAANDPWYAAIENLMQLRLLLDSPAAQGVFHERCAQFNLPASLPVTGVVLAPSAYYTSPGKKAAATPSAARLLARMGQEQHEGSSLDVRLATWDVQSRTIDVCF